MSQATSSVIYFPKQSKPAPKPKKKKTGQKRSTVLEWIRNGYQFPGKPPLAVRNERQANRLPPGQGPSDS